MAVVTVSFQLDAALKTRFDAALSGLGWTADSALSQCVKEFVEDYEIPVSPYLSTPATLAADLRMAEESRRKGYKGRDAREILAEMDRIISAAEAESQ